MRKHLRRPSPSLILGFIAVGIAIGGTAIALPGRNSVDSGDIKPRNVKTSDIAGNAVNSAKVRGESLSHNDLRDFKVIGGNYLRLRATEAANATDARTAAPVRTLFRKGPLRVQAKCFRDTTADVTHAEIYGATTRAFSIMDSTSVDLPGGNAATQFLNPNTPELNRRLATTQSGAGNNAAITEGEDVLAAPGGSALQVLHWSAAKNGNLTAGNGIYQNAGGVCLFGGSVFG